MLVQLFVAVRENSFLFTGF